MYASVCQDVSLVSVLLIVGVHVVVEEGPIISSAQWTLGRSPKRSRTGPGLLDPGPSSRPRGHPHTGVRASTRVHVYPPPQHLVVAPLACKLPRGPNTGRERGSYQDVEYGFPGIPLLKLSEKGSEPGFQPRFLPTRDG